MGIIGITSTAFRINVINYLMTKKLLSGIAIYLLSSAVFAETNLWERVELGGFARVVAGHLDESSATFEGYSNSISLSQQSLIAIQADVSISDTLSLSGQLLGHSSDERESGLEWLYLSYKPNQQWQFKLGKLRTPFFRYTDVIDVGYAYPWISPPQQVYSGFLFSNYEGVSTAYSFSVQDTNFDVEAYYGTYSGKFSRAGENIDIDVDEIKGAIVTLNRGNLNVRAAVTQSSDFFADFPGFDDFINILEFSGFNESADSLKFDGNATGYQASISYDTLDYFVSAEWVKIASDLFVVPQADAYYLTVGRNFYPFQVHLTYSTSSSSYKELENTIPIGISPQVDQLSFAYEQIVGGLPLFSLDSFTLGGRWDFHQNMSAKAEISILNGEPDENSYFDDFTDPSFNREAILYQVAIEWVF